MDLFFILKLYVIFLHACKKTAYGLKMFRRVIIRRGVGGEQPCGAHRGNCTIFRRAIVPCDVLEHMKNNDPKLMTRTTRMVVQQGPDSSEPLDSLCRIVYPESTRQKQLKGIVHFLGGAFAGAAPSTLYRRCIRTFTEAGYVVITNAYAVTFRHDVCARELDQRFGRALDEVFDTLGTTDAKVFAVGHSNGALMAAMMASMPECTNARYDGCILISFNNRQVGEAVPVPLTGIQDVLQSVDVEDRVREVVLSNSQLLDESSIDTIDVQTALTQLGSVLDEVSLGLDDFSPPPEENAVMIAHGYSSPKTLLIQFKDDDIDQSEKIFKVLKKNSRRSVTFRSMEYGTHLSPLLEGTNVARVCIDYLESRC